MVNVFKRTMLITMFPFSGSNVNSNMVFLYFPRRGGDPEIQMQAENAEFQQAPSRLGGAEVVEAEAGRVLRTGSAEASLQSNQVHHAADAEEAEAWSALSAEEAPQDHPGISS
eukprot:s2040_g2.t1